MAVSLVLEGDILTQLGLGVFKQRIAFVRRAEDEGHPPVQMAHYQALSNLELHVFSLGELSGTWVVVGQPILRTEARQFAPCCANQLVGQCFLFKREREVDMVASRFKRLYSLKVGRADV